MDYQPNQKQIIGPMFDVLDRTDQSIRRSNQIVYETEQVGTEILEGLAEQRESLLRSTGRMEDAEENLSQSAKIMRELRRNIFYNKFILVSIICVELLILSCLIIIKYIKLG